MDRVMDQGNRPSRAKKCLITDHHWSEALPEDSLVVSACRYEPFATGPLLTYGICEQLHPHVKRYTDWLAVTETYSDLGSSMKPVAVSCRARGDSDTILYEYPRFRPERSTRDNRMRYLNSVVCALSSKLIPLEFTLNFNIANCGQIEKMGRTLMQKSNDARTQPHILF